MTLILPPLSLYVHIPWCIRKCPYCDFNSHQADQTLPEDEYIEALKADLEHDVSLAQGRKLTSIFFGGGTPSLLSARGIEKILRFAEDLIGFQNTIEITLEANPGTFEQQKFSAFRSAGVNRLSIGIQSFQNQQLQLLGRVHDANEALRAIDVARTAKFDNINLDLMHGLPEQDLQAALADLTQAISCAPEHISWYQLTIEQNTAFYSSPPVLPEDDILSDIQDAGFSLLHQFGYEQYEVSAYACDTRQAQHNINYWQFGDYLGIGAGAHGKMTFPQDDSILRLWKTRLPRHYLDVRHDHVQRINTRAFDHQNSFVAGGELLSHAARPLEFMMNALRLNQGVPMEHFSERTGLPFSSIENIWQELKKKELISRDKSRLQTTALGRRYLNQVLQKFIE